MSLLQGLVLLFCVSPVGAAPHSVARQWNEELLEAIRNDAPRPTVHARNLYHVSAAMWDAWAAYDPYAGSVFHDERAGAGDVRAAREEAISFAAYRVLRWRFKMSEETLASLDARMIELGYDPGFVTVSGTSAAALGNRVAQRVIIAGLEDGSNEQGGYLDASYRSLNPALLPGLPGNPAIEEPNYWQPLALDHFSDRDGRIFAGKTSAFLGPGWGGVRPFALRADQKTMHSRENVEYTVYLDPGAPPLLGTASEAEYRAGFEQVVVASGALDPADGAVSDIGPGVRGNNTLGTNDGNGHAVNPATGRPYRPNRAPAGDFYRVLAEYWADGPDSETPPGHWFVLANAVSDHPVLKKQFGGQGRVLDALEWDVKLYLALGGAVHDAAVAAWGIKGWYDYVRPISAIRYLCGLGQSSDPEQLSWHPGGIGLRPGAIEAITPKTAAAGGIHEHLAGDGGEHIGKIALRAWRGPVHIGRAESGAAGVGWIRCEDWWPYQQPDYVTPPFAGYVSGHSTFSRAAAEVLAKFTGSAWFPGGMASFRARANEYLEFETGPGVDVVLQWATYYDAADDSGLSRIYGGIHPPADDRAGRMVGAAVGELAFERARGLFGGPGPGDRPADTAAQ